MADPTETQPVQGEDFYRRLFDQAAVAMLATDSDFNVVCLNEAACKLLGLSPQAIGKPLEQAVPPQRRRLLQRLLERTYRRMLTSELDVQLPDEQGGQRELMVILAPIPGPRGACQGVSAWIVDETNRKKLAEQLKQAEKMASLGTLAGGVAHHFNNILGGVATFVDFALTSQDPLAMKRALQMTADAAARASKITQSLLSFAKIDSHRADLADLTEVVLTFVHLVERPLAERKIKLRLDLHPVPIVEVEANRMHQVLGNLLSNAEEAMPSGGTIAISVARREKMVELVFADSGCGIQPEHLDMVFEPFFTTKGLLAGGDKVNPGLGLSVVHGIVLEMGATIAVGSTPGQGASFTISFPVPSDHG